MDEVSLNGKPQAEDEADDYVFEGDCAMTEYVCQNGVIQNPLPPSLGMEFESYEDVYYFYNCYAKEQGFGVRVSNTWYRKSKERYRAKLSCSSAGFKKKTEANRPRPETRTGCPAMIKFRLMDSKRWRIIEVELEHNHLISPSSGKFYKSYKNLGVGAKRSLQIEGYEEVRKIQLFRTVIIDAENFQSLDVDEGGFQNNVMNYCNQLKLKLGDPQAIEDFFCRLQLMDPNFFFSMDLNERGSLRNLYWVNARSRVGYSYFGDVVFIDTLCLTGKYEIPLVSFIGINHHGQSILLGCGLISGETVESYTWLFRAWLTCNVGRPPQAIITNQSATLQTVLADVFPRASHSISSSHIMRKLLENMGGFLEFEAIKVVLYRMVYDSTKPEEFESAWEDMIQQYGFKDHEWLQVLYEDRRRWVPVYLKETFLVGIFSAQPIDMASSFFEGYLDNHTGLKEFFDKYDQALHSHYQLEFMADMESRSSSSPQNSRCYFELQLSKLYTNNMLGKFEKEVEGMYSCFNTGQLNINGPIVTYIVKEQVEIDGNERETSDYEVVYNEAAMEVICICGLFNFKGYLCRHALSVLRLNGIEEIPAHYILPRWRKDIKRNYAFDQSHSGIDVDNPIHRYDRIYKKALEVVQEGRKSQDRYAIALKEMVDILSKLRLMEDES